MARESWGGALIVGFWESHSWLPEIPRVPGECSLAQLLSHMKNSFEGVTTWGVGAGLGVVPSGRKRGTSQGHQCASEAAMAR